MMREHALAFYRRYGVDHTDAEQAAETALHAVEFFLRDLQWYASDMPEPLPQQKGKGRPQINPSQRRLQIIVELEQFASFLDNNSDYQLGARWKMSALKGRRFLSCYAFEALLDGPPSGSGILTFRDASQRNSVPSEDTFVWGLPDQSSNSRLMRRGFAALAARGQPSILTLASASRPLPEALGQRLVIAAQKSPKISRNSPNHLSITSLLDAVSPEFIDVLAERSRAAAASLRIAFDIHDNQRSPGRSLPLDSFSRPAPVYQLVKRMLSASMPRGDPCDRWNVRLLDDEDSRERERKFGKLVSKALTFAQENAEAWRPDKAFDPFLGIDATAIVKDRNIPRSDPDWQKELNRLASRMAATIMRHREQTIVLRDHAETLGHWARKLSDYVGSGYSTGLLDLGTYGFYALRDWAQESEAQYEEGAFYVSDRGRRQGGATGEIRRLSVEILRRPYSCSDVLGGLRRADVTTEAIRPFLEILHSSRSDLRARVSAGLDEVKKMIALEEKGGDIGACIKRAER